MSFVLNNHLYYQVNLKCICYFSNYYANINSCQSTITKKV